MIWTALAQLSISPYSSLPTSSSCASINVPDASVPTSVSFIGEATTGTYNAFAIDFTEDESSIEVGISNMIVNFTYSGYVLPETHDVVAIDWSDGTDCSLLVEKVMHIEYAISDVTLTVAQSQFAEDTGVLTTVNVEDGTDVTVNIDLGDNSASVPTCQVRFPHAK